MLPFWWYHFFYHFSCCHFLLPFLHITIGCYHFDIAIFCYHFPPFFSWKRDTMKLSDHMIFSTVKGRPIPPPLNLKKHWWVFTPDSYECCAPRVCHNSPPHLPNWSGHQKACQ
jgi:hypothetical protein